MKTKYAVRLFAALLAALMLIAAASCAKENPSGAQTTPAATEKGAVPGSDGQTAADTEPDYDPHVAARDFEGTDFVILYNGNEVEPNHDFAAQETNGSTVNDAVYNRNVRIQEKHKLKIVTEFKSDANIMTAVTNAQSSGDAPYQLIDANQTYSMTMSIKGLLHELSDLTLIDFSKPYWNSDLLEGSSIKNKNYFAYSDANIHAVGATPCTIFNKKVHEDAKLKNIYQLVDEGNWTFAEMSEMVKAVTDDLDGDQLITKDDKLGMIANTFCIDCFISGTGYPMIKKDAEDLPELNLEQGFFEVVEAIQSLCSAENGMFLVDRTSTETEAREYWTERAITSDRALFWIGNFKCVERLRTADVNFGVVPIPKLNTDQQDYKIHMQANIGAAQSVPLSVQNVEDISAVLEDIAYDSYLNVMPIYMEILIKGQSIRDVESLKCIEIIRKSYYSDMGFMLGNYGISILGSARSTVLNNSPVVSSFQKVIKGFGNSINKLKKEVQ